MLKYQKLNLGTQMIQDEISYLKVGEEFWRIYQLTSLPKEIDFKDGHNFFQFSFRYDLVVLNNKPNPGFLSEKVLTAKAVTGAFQFINQNKVKRIKDEAQMTDLEVVERDLTNDVVYQNFTAYLVAKTSKLEDLKAINREIKNKALTKKIVFSISYFQQAKVLEQIQSKYVLHENSYLTTADVMARILPPTTEIKGDFPLGINKDEKSIFNFDLYPGNKPRHLTITGMIRSGKSTLAKSLVENMLLAGIQVFVLDPEDEFTQLAENIGGTVYNIDRTNGINPMSFNVDSIDSKNDHIIILSEFFKYFIPTDFNSTLVKEVINEFYNTHKPEKYNLNEFLDYLRKTFIQDQVVKKGYEFVRDLLQLENGQTLGGYFNALENFDVNKDFVVFNVKNIDKEEIKKPALYILSDLVKNKIFQGDRKRAFVIDEFHHFIKGNEVMKNYFVNLCLRIGKYNAFLVMITQELAHFHDNSADSLLNQAKTHFLFKQDIRHDPFIRIEDSRKLKLMSLTDGHCLIYNVGDTFAHEVQVLVSPEQIKLYQPKNIENQTNFV